MGAFLDLKSLNIPDEVKQYDLQLSGNKKNDMTLNEKQIVYGQYQQFKVPLDQYCLNFL